MKLRVAFAIFQEDSKRAEEIALALFETQPPYSLKDQTEVATQFAVAAASRTRLQRIIGAQFIDVEKSLFDPALERALYSQDHGRTILAAIGVRPATEEETVFQPNKEFAIEYQRCLREIARRAIDASNSQESEVKFVVDFGSILPETQIVLGKLVQLEWYTDFHSCRGGKQFEDHCHGCQGCRGTEAERTRAICARCTLTMKLDGKKLANSPEELERRLGIRYFW